jgi:hypothetical protein
MVAVARTTLPIFSQKHLGQTLQNQDVDSCACEQEAQHHPSGAATSNTTPALQFLS